MISNHRPFRIIILMLPVVSLILSAQSVRLQNVPSANDLSSHSVYSILRDREGFVWIGTQNGLNRYDGERFLTFTHSDQDSTTLTDDFIIALAEDTHGDIWVGTRHGLNRFDKRLQKFRRFIPFPDSFTTTHQTVYSIVCTAEGRIMAACGTKVFVVAPGDPSVVQMDARYDSVSSLTVATDGTLFIGMPGRIRRIAVNGRTEELTVPNPSGVNQVLLFHGRLYVATNRGLVVMDPGAHTAAARQRTLFGTSQVFRLSVDDRGTLWVGTEHGLYRSDGDDLRDHPFRMVNSSSIRTVFSDRSGLLWIGTLHGGLLRYDPQSELFRTVPAQLFGKNGIVWSVLQDRSNMVWAGTQRGLFAFDGDDTLFLRPRPVLPGRFGAKMIAAIEEDRSGDLWIAARNDTLYRYTIARARTDVFVLHAKSADGGRIAITDLCLRRDGSLWLTTTNGLFSFAPASRRFTRADIDHPRARPFPLYFMHLTETRDSMLWIAASHGLYRFDPRTRSSELFTYDPKDTGSVSFNIISSCLEDSKGRLWVSTLGGGINRLDRATGRCTRIERSAGLPNNVVYGLCEDRRGRLWMSTDDGIACYDPEQGSIISYGKEEGLAFLEFAQNAFYTSRSGTMYFGGIGGMVVLQPERFDAVQSEEPVVVTDLRINHTSVLPGDPVIGAGTITTPLALNLTDEHRTISIDFASLNFRSGSRARYSYRLNGFDEHWVYPDRGLHTAQYTHLPPGTYSFEVRCTQQPGVWSGTMLSIMMTVHPPFWRTWWFLSLCTISVAGISFSGVRYLSQKKLKERLRDAELQQRLQSERERISRELHDSTGANLAGIIAGLDMAEKYLDRSSAKTKRTLRSLTVDARLSMSQLRETIWAMRTAGMSLAVFTESVNDGIRRQVKYRKGVKFRMEVQADESITLSPIQVLHLFRIIQEAVTNGLKHSVLRHLTVSFAGHGRSLIVTVVNDGTRTRRKKEGALHGHGMGNMERRATELGGELQMQFGDAEGCRLTVTIPLDPPGGNTPNGVL